VKTEQIQGPPTAISSRSVKLDFDEVVASLNAKESDC